MHKILSYFFNLTGNYGYAIILLTILVRLVFFPLNQYSMKSMGKMKSLGPEIENLKSRYKDLLLVLVPRHPVRSKLIGAIFEREGVSAHYESLLGGLHDMDKVSVLIGDVMGSLFDLYGLADIATVGGSFVDVGGHNPIAVSYTHLTLPTKA